MATIMNPGLTGTTFDAARPASYQYFDLDPSMHQHLQYTDKHPYTSGPGGVNVVTEGSTVEPTKPGLMTRITHGVQDLADRVGMYGNTQTRWALFGLQDQLLSEFPCKVVNMDKIIRGYMFLSANYLCFASHTDVNNRLIKFMLPWNSISDIRQAQRVNTGTGMLPKFLPLASMSTKPNAMQIVTNDGLLHQFFGFRTQYINAFNLVMHTWNSARGIGTHQMGQPMMTGMTTMQQPMMQQPLMQQPMTTGMTQPTMLQQPLMQQPKTFETVLPSQGSSSTTTTTTTTAYPLQK